MGQLSVDLSAKMEALKTKTTNKTKTGNRIPALLYTTTGSRQDPLRRGPVGDPDRLHRQRQRLGHFRAARRRSAGRLVADRHQHRRQQVFPRQARLARARDQRGATGASAWSTPSPTGARRTATSRPPQDGENFRNELAHLMLTQKACFNSPVWFNVGVKETRGYGWIYDEADRPRSRSSSPA